MKPCCLLFNVVVETFVARCFEYRAAGQSPCENHLAQRPLSLLLGSWLKDVTGKLCVSIPSLVFEIYYLAHPSQDVRFSKLLFFCVFLCMLLNSSLAPPLGASRLWVLISCCRAISRTSKWGLMDQRKVFSLFLSCVLWACGSSFFCEAKLSLVPLSASIATTMWCLMATRKYLGTEETHKTCGDLGVTLFGDIPSRQGLLFSDVDLILSKLLLSNAGLGNC
ncbi:hypothetical protein KP509_27G024300 [Ceratopteris richardii]|uniref:Uncharacterized protein n=1 Tax=Ceratopteris richardii TaxID=49495 RepID=A0A8T2RGQ8_CERRI|nr:hypothetical protein KP509_27G024300 [Ceratopteris richardii]